MIIVCLHKAIYSQSFQSNINNFQIDQFDSPGINSSEGVLFYTPWTSKLEPHHRLQVTVISRTLHCLKGWSLTSLKRLQSAYSKLLRQSELNFEVITFIKNRLTAFLLYVDFAYIRTHTHTYMCVYMCACFLWDDNYCSNSILKT